MPQIFNALNGPEILEFLVSKFRDALVNTGEFKTHQTYPWFKYKFEVGITTYPKQSKDDKPGIVAKGEQTPEDPTPSDERPVKFELVEEKVIDTPDEARIESNQPVPVQTTVVIGEGGPNPQSMIVDKPVEHKIPIKKHGGMGYGSK